MAHGVWRMEGYSMENWQQAIQDAMTNYGPSVLGSIAILVIG